MWRYAVYKPSVLSPKRALVITASGTVMTTNDYTWTTAAVRYWHHLYNSIILRISIVWRKMIIVHFFQHFSFGPYLLFFVAFFTWISRLPILKDHLRTVIFKNKFYGWLITPWLVKTLKFTLNLVYFCLCHLPFFLHSVSLFFMSYFVFSFLQCIACS